MSTRIHPSILNADLSSLGKSKKTGKLTPPDQWSLSVDLLPKSVAAINKDRQIAKIMGFVTVGVLVLCFIAGLVANQFVVAARGATDDARLQQTTLTARKAEFKEIQDVLVASYDINVARVAALYGEVNWLVVTDQLRPVGVHRIARRCGDQLRNHHQERELRNRCRCHFAE